MGNCYRKRTVDKASASCIAGRVLTMDEFDQLTMNKQLQRYIALLDGRIKFFDIPNCPHAEIIGHLTFTIGNQLGIGTPGSMLVFESDNGMSLFETC
jgi:hypothetical protein